jgi:dTMP kinase
VSPRLRQGCLVTLEGGEGAGKTVQAQALADRLRDHDYAVFVTREPAGTELGDVVKSVFERGIAATPEAELFLFAAARAQHVYEVIRPALERGDVVLCDRYTDSTLAYQGYGRGLSLDHLRAVNHIATSGLQPHFTLLFDLPPEAGLARKAGERLRDRIGDEGLEFHRRVREGYLALAKREPKRIALIDASDPPASVTEAAWKRLQAFLDHLL